jgi:hypothetical protein
MLSFRKIALVAIGAALVVVAPAVGKSVTGSASADPTARITGGDAPPPIPSIVNTRLVRAEAALGRATADYDENQPAQAVVPIGAALSNTAKSWGAEKYIIKTTPPTPVGDAVGDGTGGAATAYAGPEDTGVAILNAQHDVITTSVSMVETTNAALQKSLLSAISSAASAMKTEITYIHSIAPPPAADGVQADGTGAGSTWDTVMPNVAPVLQDEIQQLAGRQALNKFPSAVASALSAARLKANDTLNQLNTWWPPVPAG